MVGLQRKKLSTTRVRVLVGFNVCCYCCLQRTQHHRVKLEAQVAHHRQDRSKDCNQKTQVLQSTTSNAGKLIKHKAITHTWLSSCRSVASVDHMHWINITPLESNTICCSLVQYKSVPWRLSTTNLQERHASRNTFLKGAERLHASSVITIHIHNL